MDKAHSFVAGINKPNQDGLENASSEAESSEEGGGGRREAVTIEVAVATWVSLLLDL
jgi:hypothetical protein